MSNAYEDARIILDSPFRWECNFDGYRYIVYSSPSMRGFKGARLKLDENKRYIAECICTKQRAAQFVTSHLKKEFNIKGRFQNKKFL